MSDDAEDRRAAVIALAERLRTDMTSLMTDRETWRGFRDAVARSSSLRSNHFTDSVARWYVAHAVLGVRRLVDDDRHALSLSKLLSKMIARPGDFPASFFESLWRTEYPQYGLDEIGFLARSTYAPFSDATGQHLDVTKLEADRTSIVDAVAHIKSFADRHVAHSDRRGPKRPVTWNDLDEALDAAAKLSKKYIALLTGASLSSFAAVPQYDWTAIFRHLHDDGGTVNS